MRQLVLCSFLLLGGAVQALPRYYVFGAAEDDCVINKTKVEGEACLCIQVNMLAQDRVWAIDWNVPDCKQQKKNSFNSSIDCEGGGCTQHECLEEVYDTQHGDNETVSEHTCVENHLPMLG